MEWSRGYDHLQSRTSIVSFESAKESQHKSDDLLAFYCSVIRSVLEFSCQLFHRSLPKYLSDDIERIQRLVLRIIFPSLSYCKAIDKAEIPTLSERRGSLSIKLFKDIVSNEHHKLANPANLLPSLASSHARRLRNKRRYNKTSLSHRSFHELFYYKPRDVNNF